MKKLQFLKTVALVRGTRIRQSASLRVSKLDVFFSRAILAAENKLSLIQKAYAYKGVIEVF
ncbi:MAG: hypothetical protein ACTTH7_09980 [Treponema sp.]